MAKPEPRVLFTGDLGDPWVAGIAAALAPETIRVSCAGELPENWPAAAAPARVLVLHRRLLTAADADRLARDRRSGRFDRVVLCVGDCARYHQVQSFASGLADVVLPEATAAEVVARHVGVPEERSGGPRPSQRQRTGPAVAVVSSLFELRSMLADACAAAGYTVVAARNWSEAPRARLAIWDVPVLEPSWPEILAHAAGERSVVALLGFADRVIVARARSSGAAACLDLPCDPADLAFVLERLGRYWRAARIEPAHTLPPRPRTVPDLGARHRDGARGSARFQ